MNNIDLPNFDATPSQDLICDDVAGELLTLVQFLWLDDSADTIFSLVGYQQKSPYIFRLFSCDRYSMLVK